MDNSKLVNKYRTLTAEVVYRCAIAHIAHIEVIKDETKFHEDLFRTWEVEQLPKEDRDYNRYDSEGNVMKNGNGRDMKKRRIVSVGMKAKLMIEYILMTFAMECNAFGASQTDNVGQELRDWARDHYTHSVSCVLIEMWNDYVDVVEYDVSPDYTEWIIDELAGVIVNDRVRVAYAQIVYSFLRMLAIHYSYLKWEAKTPLHERSITAVIEILTSRTEHQFSDKYIASAKTYRKGDEIDWIPDKQVDDSDDDSDEDYIPVRDSSEGSDSDDE